MPLELDGVSMKKAQIEGMAALEELGLADRADTVSRRAFGRRASTRRDRPCGRWESQLLLADEPSGALDSINGEAVMRMILAACHEASPRSSSPTTPNWRRGPIGSCSCATGEPSTRRSRHRAPEALLQLNVLTPPS